MRKILSFFAMVLFMPALAFAQAAAAPVQTATVYVPPQWLVDILTWVQALPKVGPVVIIVLTAISVLATVMTVVSGFLEGIIKATSGIAALAGLDKFAQSLLDFYKKIEPYVKYLSMFNVQKAAATASPQDPPASK